MTPNEMDALAQDLFDCARMAYALTEDVTRILRTLDADLPKQTPTAEESGPLSTLASLHDLPHTLSNSAHILSTAAHQWADEAYRCRHCPPQSK